VQNTYSREATAEGHAVQLEPAWAARADFITVCSLSATMCTPSAPRRQRPFHLSDHCPIGLSWGSKTAFERQLCRSILFRDGFISHYHDTGPEKLLLSRLLPISAE
jgi:hypothetical protein